MNINELVTGYADLRSKVAKGITVRPAADAPADDWKAYRKTIGVPESPDGYALDRPTLPEGMVYNEPFEKWFRQQAHELDIPDAIAKQLYARYNAANIEAHKQQLAAQAKATQERSQKAEQQAQDAKRELQTKFGGKSDEVVTLAQSVYRALPEATRNSIKATGLDRDPAFIETLYWYGRATAADSPLKLGNEGGDGEGDGTPRLDYGKGFKNRYPNRRK